LAPKRSALIGEKSKSSEAKNVRFLMLSYIFLDFYGFSHGGTLQYGYITTTAHWRTKGQQTWENQATLGSTALGNWRS
jgi:hypothetical protein